MPAPVLSSFAQELYNHLAPMAYDDANQGYALALFCDGIGKMFQQVEDLSRDQVLAGGKVAPGWSQALDAARCPAFALPWLAQFVGAVIDNRLSTADQRQQLQQVNNWKRGSLAAIQAAPAPYLTGTKRVIIRERWNAITNQSDPYAFQVITYTPETVDPVAAGAALLAQKPAGDVMVYSVNNGQDYTSLRAGYATYAAAKAHYTSYNGVLVDEPGI